MAEPTFGARWAAALGLRAPAAAPAVVDREPREAESGAKTKSEREEEIKGEIKGEGDGDRRLAAHRARFSRLQDALVFKVDAAGAADPLSAFAAERELERGRERERAQELEQERERARSQGGGGGGGSPSGWAQYFADESLRCEIDTDLDRLYPTGNESFFQRPDYLAVLRHVLFVWCKLHPDVSYRQGMHDVAAIVMYAFLAPSGRLHGGSETTTAPSPPTSEPQPHDAGLPNTIEADTFMVFEAVMLYLKPFYEIVKTAPPQDREREQEQNQDQSLATAEYSTDASEPRLFCSFSPEKLGSDDASSLFGAGGTSAPFPSAANTDASSTATRQQSQNGSPDKNDRQLPPMAALHRLCQHVQHELLQQKDPQLYFHLKNLDIVPETYCLRWIRLLFAREFSLDDVLLLWDAMIVDDQRDPVVYPEGAFLDDSTCAPGEKYGNDGCSYALPYVERSSIDGYWHGFPLLRFVCVAKLLEIAPKLRQSDNTGCLRLLMHSGSGGISSDELDSESSPAAKAEEIRSRTLQTVSLIRFSRVLRDPMLEELEYVHTTGSINDEGNDEGIYEGNENVGEVGVNGYDTVQLDTADSDLGAVVVVEFRGALGIVLTAARSPYEGRLAVKSFVEDPSSTDGLGAAQRGGKVKVGDILQSINGVPIVGLTTEEVKRYIQLLEKPVFIGFRRFAGNIDQLIEEPANDNLSMETQDPVDAVADHFLPGEMCYAHIDTSIQRYTLSPDGSCISHYISGKLYITNYRCFFTRVIGKGEIDWQVPVLAISSIDGTNMGGGSVVSGSSTSGIPGALDYAQSPFGLSRTSSYLYNTVIRCKDTQVARLSFSNHSEYSKLVKCLNWLAFPTNLLDAFCFAYSPTVAPSDEISFDLRLEYQRIGLFDFPNRLRCIDQSSRYDLCDTYPQHLIVPSDISDVRIKAAASFRAHNRLPVVSWIHRGNGATICRSSQPLVGLKSARSLEDELLVRLLCISNNQGAFGSHVIMDARSQLAAVGNKAMGKGTEIPANYRGCKLVFMNIENIHAIRQSLQALAAVFEPRGGVLDDASSSPSFYGKIESSGWLKHVRLILKSSVDLALSVHNGVSVLTHCSDGWDRTAQMVSLAELMLDPFYRTLRGFQVLIEKEWCSFGHQFALRCGHGRNDANNDQRSPVFLMWLDCVWQYIRQFPTECEFNEGLLLALADHAYSCKFGTFMFDCERQRKEYFGKYRVYSIWSAINANNERFTNELFAPSDSPASLLAPSTLSKNIKLWKGYFCRWDPTMIPPVPAFQYY